ncbi:MAG TPA: hypothetical protein VHT91_30385 [Kofleriaceae bacterium]|nr:hypothetical protein [Kofleriaceae bacterium]
MSLARSDPSRWKPAYPAYVPFLATDDADGLWGARLVMRFTRAQLHAAVEAAQLSDPRSVEYLTDMLVERQRATGLTWFSRLDPLDHFAIAAGPEGATLTFDDLALVYRLRDDAATIHYRVTALDRDGHPIAAAVVGRADPDGHASVGAIALASGRDGYTMLRITTTRPGTRPPTVVHVARDPGSQQLRVIGIWRQPSR